MLAIHSGVTSPFVCHAMEFHFDRSEIFVHRDPKSGDVIQSGKPKSWDGVFALYRQGGVPEDFMGPSDRVQPRQDRDPFKGWTVLD